MKIIFFHDPRSLNDATSYYITLVEKSFKSINSEFNFHYMNTLENVGRKDVIFTITAKYFVKAKVKYPFNKTLFWAQGVSPEESIMHGDKSWKYYTKAFIEMLALKLSDLNLLVSTSMLNHYKNKYRYNKQNYLIMPCYNILYDSSVFSPKYSDRYKANTFVYAGSMAAWQCVEESIEIFSLIQKQDATARLTLFVKESDQAMKLIEKYGVNNYTISYVALDKLQNELMKFKYGFLIREDNVVNNVATPTKMNSYLASGVIPIFTSAVHAFTENINLGGDTICLDANSDVHTQAELILNHINKPVNLESLNKHIKNIFDSYYNDAIYLELIKKNILKHLLK